MKRRSFLSLVAGAPLAAIVPAMAKSAALPKLIHDGAITAANILPDVVSPSQLSAGAVSAEKIKVESLSAISARLANVTIRNATIGPRFVSSSNIYAPLITAERNAL